MAPSDDRSIMPVRGRSSDEDRTELLDRAITAYAKHGYRVRSRSRFRAVVAKRQRVHVGMNVVMTIVTGGLWLIVLAVRLLNWPVDAVVLTVDEHGDLIPDFVS